MPAPQRPAPQKKDKNLGIELFEKVKSTGAANYSVHAVLKYVVV